MSANKSGESFIMSKLKFTNIRDHVAHFMLSGTRTEISVNTEEFPEVEVAISHPEYYNGTWFVAAKSTFENELSLKRAIVDTLNYIKPFAVKAERFGSNVEECLDRVIDGTYACMEVA